MDQASENQDLGLENNDSDWMVASGASLLPMHTYSFSSQQHQHQLTRQPTSTEY